MGFESIYFAAANQRLAPHSEFRKDDIFSFLDTFRSKLPVRSWELEVG
jgi:hypothetical protein